MELLIAVSISRETKLACSKTDLHSVSFEAVVPVVSLQLEELVGDTSAAFFPP